MTVAFTRGKMKTTDRQDEYAEVSEMDNKVIVATYGVIFGINIPVFLTETYWSPQEFVHYRP